MNIFFGCQGSITKHFIHLDNLLCKEVTNYSSHFWIGDRFDVIKNNYVNYFEKKNIKLFKEWDFVNKKNNTSDDVKKYINIKYKGFNLWDIILADRRLMYGPESKYKQKYKSRYNFDELKNIILNTLFILDNYIIEKKIDTIVTFVPSCFGTYILNVIAEKNKINLRQLRASKIEDLVIFSDTIKATPNNIKLKYNENVKNYPNIKYQEQSDMYIDSVLNNNAKYTGSERLNEKYFQKFINLLKKNKNLLKYYKNADEHNKVNFIDLYFHRLIISKLKKFRINQILNKRLIHSKSINKNNILFYPLNSEPEIAISIHSRSHQNQIETIRRISQSIPLNWILVIKEHPRSIGIRSLNYYKKILEIPNVFFFKHTESIKNCINRCSAVCTLTGFIGFEALVQKKPIILLGDSFYSSLPDSMVRTVKDMNNFYDVFNDLLSKYQYSKKHLVSLISAYFESGKKIDIYKTILNKPVKKSENNLSYDESIENLKNLLLNK
jgi:hypothetical protein